MYVRRCAFRSLSTFLSFSFPRVFSNPAFLTQRGESQRLEVQYRVPVSAGTLLLIFTLHPVHRVEHFHVVRLGAVLSALHFAVKLSKIVRVGAAVLFVKLGGATGPYLSPVHDMPLANLPRRPHTSRFVPGEF